MPERPTPPQNSESERFPREGENQRDYTYRMKMLSVEQKRAAEKGWARKGENPDKVVKRSIEQAKKWVEDSLTDFVAKLRNVDKDPDAMGWGFYNVINFLFGRHCTSENVYRGYHGNSSELLTPEEEIAVAEKVVKKTRLTLAEAEALEAKCVAKINERRKAEEDEKKQRGDTREKIDDVLSEK